MAKIDIKGLAAKAAKMANHNEVKTTQDFPIPPAGKTVGRFVEYIELGVQPRKAFAGKAKNPAAQVKIAFELLHPKQNIREIEVDGKKVKVADRINLSPMLLSTSDRAQFKKMYDAMRYGREGIEHMAQMLGDAFIIEIEHNTVTGKDNKQKTYANIKTISPPRIDDPISGTSKEVPVPTALSDLKLFLFDTPTPETWASLFIDGTTEIKGEDGSTTQRSKNWIQELILKAKNFEGSALQQMLEGADGLAEFEEAESADEELADLDLGDTDEVVEEVEVEEVVEAPKPKAKMVAAKKPAPAVATKTAAKSAPVAAKTAKAAATAKTASPSKATAKPKTAASAEDALAELGLFGDDE